MIINISCFLLSVLLTTFVLQKVINFAHKNRIFDKPDNRKQKKIQMIRIGGISFVFAYLFTILILIYYESHNNTIYFDNDLMKIIFLGSIGYFIIGLSDDLFNVSPIKRLFFQIILALLVWKIGFRIYPPELNILSFLSSSEIILKSTSLFITCFWILSVVNSINWLDGLDGLAAGCAIIFLFTLFLINLTNYNYQLNLLIIPFFGCLAAFLKYNFYPSKVLMGDGGSYFIGFNMSILSIISPIPLNGNLVLDKIDFRLLFVAIIIFAIPLFDMLKVIFYRIYKRNSPFLPDRNHLHHQILNLGLSETQAVIFIYFFSVLFGQLALKLYSRLSIN